MDDPVFREHIDRLKATCCGAEIAVAFGLRGKGKRFFCPTCQPDGGKSPDLAVFDQGFKCYKCGLTGDVIDLIVLAGAMSKAGAIAYLETQSGISRPKKMYQGRGRAKIVDSRTTGKAITGQKTGQDAGHVELYAAFLGTVCQPIQGTPGADYLEGRGIAAAAASQYGVRYCPDLTGLWALADRETIKAAGLASLYVFQKAGLPVLAFPYIHQGQPVFIKTRCLLAKAEADRREVPRFLNTGGAVPCLWNHDAVAGADQVMICEGEIDALSAIAAGFVAVGLPGWSHWKDAWTRDFAGKEVILVLDADDAGQKGTADIASRFSQVGLPCPRQLILDAGTDLNDLLLAFVKDGKK